MGEVEAEHSGDRGGSLCQHLPKTERLSPPSLWPLVGWTHPIPERGLRRAPSRTNMSRTRGEETCCWRRSGRSWNCIWGRSCWRSHCLCPGLCPGPGLDLYPGPCHGCSSCGCCCRGGCGNGGGCGAAGGCGHLFGSPGCLAGTLCRPCDPSGDGSDGNGTLRKNLSLAGGGKRTSLSRSLLPHSGPLSLYLGPGPTSGAVRIGRREVAEAWRSGARCVARALRYWGMGGSTVAHWDGTMWLGGTWGDLGDTLKALVRPQSSETFCIPRL